MCDVPVESSHLSQTLWGFILPRRIFSPFPPTLCSVATARCHFQETEIFWGSALFFNLDFVLIPSSGEMLTNLIFGAKVSVNPFHCLKQ